MPRRRGFPALLAAVCAVGLAIRLAYTLAWADGLRVWGDALTYHVVGGQLADGNGFFRPPIPQLAAPLGTGPTAEHPPLFEVLVAALDLLGIDSTLGQKGVLCFVGTGTIALIGLAARRLAGDGVGLVAAAIAAAYPMLWMADGALMSETLYGLLIAAVLFVAIGFARRPATKTALVLGVLVGLAAVTRGEALLLAVTLIVPLAFTRPVGRRTAALHAAAGLAAMAIVLAPWTIRNFVTFDKPVVISTNSSAVVVGSNCEPSYHGHYLGLWWFPCYGSEPPGDESEKAAEYRRRGLEYARDHLGRLPVVAAARIGRVWDVYQPDQGVIYERLEGRVRAASWLGLGFYYPLVVLAIAGAVVLHRRRAPLLPLLALPFTVTLTAVYAYGVTRFRFAAEPAIVILAAVALTALAERVRGGSLSAGLGRRAPTPHPAGQAAHHSATQDA